MLYVRERTDLLERPARLLHLAPEWCLQQVFTHTPTIDYISGDIASPWAATCLDLCTLPFKVNRFDAVICNHVLEHIPNDRLAMREILRVLKPDGWAVLMAPLSRQAATDEDPAVASPHERKARFGQRDHVRLYGQDYAARLEEAGFRVELVDLAQALQPADVTRLGLWGDERIPVCRKPSQMLSPLETIETERSEVLEQSHRIAP
jgi:SAM-dependent methyltransferase